MFRDKTFLYVYVALSCSFLLCLLLCVCLFFCLCFMHHNNSISFAQFDPVFKEHVAKIKQSQTNAQRLQAINSQQIL